MTPEEIAELQEQIGDYEPYLPASEVVSTGTQPEVQPVLTHHQPLLTPTRLPQLGSNLGAFEESKEVAQRVV